MNFYDIGIISFALGLDAFSVAFSLGLSKDTNKKKTVAIIFIFGFFQFLFVTFGGYFGRLFNIYFFHISSRLGGIIILLVGFLMLKDSLSKEKSVSNLNFIIIILLGICVSIDALVIGFTLFSTYSLSILIFENTCVVGIAASLLTAIGLLISKKMRKSLFLKEYANLLGGIILILFGLHMIF